MYKSDHSLITILSQEIKNLQKLDIKKVAKRSGAILTSKKDNLKLPFLSREITISLPGYRNINNPHNQVPLIFKIVILKYLNKTYLNPDMNIKGRWISFRELPDGLFYSKTIKKEVETPLARFFSSEKELYSRVCAELGGKRDEKFSEGMIFSLFPKFMLLFKFWPKDEEFPAEAKILFDITAVNLFNADEIKMILIYFARLLIKCAKKYLQIHTKNI